MSAVCGTSGSCDTVAGAGACGSESRSGCPCGTPGCSGDPVGCATGMWTSAFFQALKAAQAELVKARIQKAWGAKMEKAADAVVEAMGIQWQSMVAQAGAKAQLQERLAAIWRESQK